MQLETMFESAVQGNATKTPSRNTAILGLVLVGSAPTISVVSGFVFQVGILAAFIFVLTKIWVFGLPGLWHLQIEKNQFSWSPANRGGWGMSLLLGSGMMVVVWGAYVLLGEQMLQPEALKAILDPVGLTVPWKFATAIVFWVFINSVLEEYVFRWFITSKIEQIIGGKWRSIFLASGVFTLHHSIALAFFLEPLGVCIASLGVFIGGAIFSWLYLEYRSIWVAWVAHACADVAIFTVAWNLVIGF